MQFATRFSGVKDVGLEFKSPSLTQTHFQRDTDINVMVQRFLRGDMSVLRPQINAGVQDARFVPDNLHDVENVKARSRTVWETLPDQVKQSYGNPERFLDAYFAELKAKADAEEAANAEEAAKAATIGKTDSVTALPASGSQSA